jgi:signal transduction histidine kinase
MDHPATLEMSDFFSDLSGVINTNRVWCVYYLRSGMEYLGFIVYEASDRVHPQMCSAAVFLANTVKRLQIYKDEKKQSVKLEQEVTVRTRDLSETYRKLQEEVQRRMAVEAEVLRISEIERLRFSMDLHDDICQRLAGISMFCKSMMHGVSPQSFLPELSELIDETLARTRRYAHDSFPVELDALGLKEALDALCYTVTRQNACRCIFSWSAPDKSLFTSAQDLNIYRIVQEAIQNAVKHAGANRINVNVRAKEGIFSVTILDNGSGGLRPDEENSLSTDIKRYIKGGGLGLRSMRYRAHQLGAEYIFKSSEEGGTRVEIRIPLRQP